MVPTAVKPAGFLRRAGPYGDVNGCSYPDNNLTEPPCNRVRPAGFARAHATRRWSIFSGWWEGRVMTVQGGNLTGGHILSVIVGYVTMQFGNT